MRLRTLSSAVAAGAVLAVGAPLFLLRAGEPNPTEIVYLESGPDDDRSRLVVEPIVPEDDDPDDERIVMHVTHERGWMPRGALGPDGKVVALVRQPRGRSEREAAELVRIDLDTQEERAAELPVFGLSTPVFARIGQNRLYVTSAAIARPAPTDDEMRAGRLNPIDFSVWEVDPETMGTSLLFDERATYLHPIGVAFVRIDPHAAAVPSLVFYRVTHGGNQLAAANLLTREAPVNVANLDFAMARDFDLSDDGEALVFLATTPGEVVSRVLVQYLAQGGAPQQLGTNVEPTASPGWASGFREWFFSRRPPRGNRGEEPPLRLHRASARTPTGRLLDSLTQMTGVAEGSEVLVENGVAPGGRYCVVRTDPGEGPIYFVRDTLADPQTARPLGEGGLVRVLGFR